MWLMSYMTKNSITSPRAVAGDVKGQDGKTVIASGEHKNLALCAPYGVYAVPPVGARAVVLPLDDGEVSLGVIAPSAELAEGEIMLRSAGGASVVLKNDGRVLINGREFGNE